MRDSPGLGYETTLPRREEQDFSSSSQPRQHTTTRDPDLEGDIYGRENSANELVQADEPYDALPVQKAAKEGDI